MDRPKRRWFVIAGLALGIALVLLARSILVPEAPEHAPANVEVPQSAQQTPEPVPSPAAATEPATETAPLKPEPAIAGGTLSGRVIDAATRVPVKEFELRLQVDPRRNPDQKPPVTQTFQSSSGRFAWKGAPAGSWTLSATARGYQVFEIAELTIVKDRTTRDVVLPLLRGHALAGRVIDENTGAGIESARISFRESHEDRYSFRTFSRNFATTKDDGSFVLEGVPGGRITLSVGAQDYAMRELEVLVGDKTAPAQIALSKGGVIRGFLATEDGAPVAGSVNLFNIEQRRGFGGTNTNDAGEFSYERLQAGRYRLSGHAEFGGGSIEVVLAHNERLEGVVLTLGRGHNIRGVVRGLSSEQLKEASVTLQHFGKQGVGFNSRIDDQGSYVLRGVPPGRAHITLYASAGAGRQLSKSVEMPAGQDLTLNFDIPLGARLSGRVSHAGKAVVGKSVFVSPVEQSQGTFNHSRTSGTGAYEIEGLPAGEYYVHAEGAAIRRIKVMSDTVVDIEIPSTELGGRVLEEGSDLPIIGAGIHVTGLQAATTNVRIYRETDHFGRFAVTGLEAGEVLLSIYKPGYEMVRERMTYGSPITNMTTRLRQSSGVEVKAQAADTGRPRRELFVVELLGNGTRGIQLRVRLDDSGAGSLPSALAGSTLNIHGGSATPTVIREWNAQPLDLKL